MSDFGVARAGATPNGARIGRSRAFLAWGLWTMVALFTAVSIAHQEQAAIRRRADRLTRYAHMLAQDLWDLDEESAQRILQVLANAERCETLTIKLSDGTPFAEVAASGSAGTVARAGQGSAPIVYDGRLLGTLTIRGQRRDIGVYLIQVLGVLLLAGLVHVGTVTLHHRRELEHVRLSGEIALREEVEARLRQREGELRRAQRLEALGKIAGGVAHDFNNLLTVIIGFAELAQVARTDDKRQEHLKTLLEATERARSLTAQLLSFGRQPTSKLSAVDINAAIVGMRGLLVSLLPDGLRLDTQLAEDLGPARVDPSQLEQLIMNLVLNARDAMPNGGTIRVSTRRHMEMGKSRIALTVEDQGVGMDEELKAMIFEPFFSTKAPGKGTGLGLAMVQSIVEQNGGTIELKSAPGEGSTFTVMLDELVAGIPPSDTSGEGAALPAAQGLRLLVVEDDPAVRGLVRELLEGSGFQVTTARDAEDALRILQRSTPRVDAVLSDVVMPKTSGPELQQLARHAGIDVPFVFMSGHVPRDVRIDEGALLNKPFTRAELMSTIDRVLRAGKSGLRA